MISGTWPRQLNETTSFPWSKRGFRYLGTITTPETTKPFDANYNKLLKQIRNDLTGWKVLPLSLFGRVEIVKMNLPPRLLFLCQSLPIKVPMSTFKTLDKFMNLYGNIRGRE